MRQASRLECLQRRPRQASVIAGLEIATAQMSGRGCRKTGPVCRKIGLCTNRCRSHPGSSHPLFFYKRAMIRVQRGAATRLDYVRDLLRQDTRGAPRWFNVRCTLLQGALIETFYRRKLSPPADHCHRVCGQTARRALTPGLGSARYPICSGAAWVSRPDWSGDSHSNGRRPCRRRNSQPIGTS
jgi:hypothetical protein